MARNPLTELGQHALDTAYTVIGLGILGYQRAQVRRRELAEGTGAPRALSLLGEQLAAQVRTVEEAVRPQLDALRPQLDALRPQLDALRPQLDALRPEAEALGAQLVAAGAALRPQVEIVGAQLAELARTVEERVAPVRREVDATIEEVEGHLPPLARATVEHLRAGASLREQVLRQALGLDGRPGGTPATPPPGDGPAA